MGPGGQSSEASKYAIGQHDRDHASRQQTFASEGDAIFLPKTAETLPTGRPLPFADASSKSSNPYASFAAPTMRNPNPFSNNQAQVQQVQVSRQQQQQQQQAQQQQQTQSHFNMIGSTKPTSPNSHSPTNPFLPQSSNGVSLLRTGTSTSEARGSTRSSPSLSVESTVGSTTQSSVKMSMSHQDASTTSTGSSTLPPIPDITSSNGQQAGQASTTSKRSGSFVSISSSNQSQSNSNDGNGNGKGPLSFTPFISTAQLRNHPKTGHADFVTSYHSGQLDTWRNRKCKVVSHDLQVVQRFESHA